MPNQSLLLKYSDAGFPRYTSYPTAPNFSDKITSEIHKSWLKNLPENQSISLYFHIPFCDQLCWYCGCFTTITKRYSPVENYCQILLREVRLVADLIREKNLRVAHIHFGGGSPTMLLPQDFSELMNEIREHFALDEKAEIAIEIDPRTVNEEKIRTYKKTGVNRASIGVQDFDEEVQKAVNREQSFDLVYDCVKTLRANEINDINLDLIYGLPKQTVESVKKNIDYSLLLKPSRIALFAYAHVTWKKKQMRLIKEEDLPNAQSRIEMFTQASAKLSESGYVAIGLDHFVKENDSMFLALKDGSIKRNFQGYSSDSAEILLGFGASAISHLPSGYTQNTLDFESYKKAILGENLPTAKGVATTDEDKIRKKIIDELMCHFEVDLNKICKSFGLDKTYFGKEIKGLEELEKDKLVQIKNNKIKINSNAPQISRVVCSFFDEYFQRQKQRYSKI